MSTVTAINPLELLGVAREALPRHVAIIMDGNGRWARQRGRQRVEGHRAGVDSVRNVVTHCARLGIECLTLYSFSIENWKRPQAEVNALMALCAEYLVRERQEIMDHNIRVRQVGRRAGLPDSVRRELEQTEQISGGNSGLTLCLALNYGARLELVDACRALAARVAAGELQPDEIDEAQIARNLYTADLPDPDLVIRTAGEMRISNFLLWQISYAELYVTPTLWPDFRSSDLDEAIVEFARRERRYGDIHAKGPDGAPAAGKQPGAHE